MRVAIDARELAGKPTGVGRYLRALVECWSRDPEARRHEWHFYAHTAVRVPEALPGSQTVVPGSGGTAWEQWTLARALASSRPDVLFAPGYTAPLTAAAPIALTVHDVSFAAHPEWFTPREGRRRRMLSAWAARRARVVLTDSEFSRRELMTHFGIPQDKVRVIPLGVTTAAAVSRHEREPMVLYVGSIFARRHVDQLIRVFAAHVAPRVPGSRLEIVGERRGHPPVDLAGAMRTLPPDIAGRIALRAYVDEPLLAELYARASAFVFLSEYEGFGLTPLEALAAGVPSIVLDTPVAREVYGPAARYVSDAGATMALADAMIALLTDAAARRAVLDHAPAVLARYKWEAAARQTLAALAEAAGA